MGNGKKFMVRIAALSSCAGSFPPCLPPSHGLTLILLGFAFALIALLRHSSSQR